MTKLTPDEKCAAGGSLLVPPERKRSPFVRIEDWTKGREFSSLRVRRRHSWARTPGISSVIMSLPKNSI
jgi:hypothetical protein